MRSAPAVEGEFFTFNRNRVLATTVTAKRNSFLYSLFALATVFIFVLISAAPAKAGNASPFDQSVIDDAMGVSMVAFGTGDSPSVVKSAQAFYFLSLVAHFDPNATSSSGTSVATHVLAFYRFYVAGGHEPACSNPLYGWGDGPVAQGLLMIKNTPALWNALTSTEQGKSDLLISAMAIAGNWAFNDQNNFTTGLGGGGNFKKTNNPNFVQSYIGIELACSIYFGGASGCNNVFTTFDYNTFTAKLTTAGFTNITSNWSKTGATAMNAAVKAPFVYNSTSLTDPNGIFYQEAVNLPNAMYNGTVSNTGCSGAAHIVSGSSPELNQLGGAHEFASTDSSGCRSDALYVYEGWMGSIEGRAALKVFNLWGETGSNPTQVAASGTQMLVGSTDLVYKLHQGYVGVSYLGTRTITDAPTDQPAGKGYLYIHNIWDKLIDVSNPPDFSLAATPATQTVVAGNNASFTATTTVVNGFNGSVSLGVSGLPSGATSSFNPTSVTGAGSSTLTVTTSSSTSAGTYTLTVTGTSGSLSHSATVTLTVNPPPDFSLSSTTSAPQTVIVGNGASYTAAVGALNGFSGSVTLSATGLPSGASASFSPTSISTSGNSILTVTTDSTTPTGSYTLTITGTSGSLTHSATVTLVVNDFSLAATPSSQTVTAGGNTTYTSTVSALNGFSGTVSLSAGGLPTGATASFSPTSVNGSGSSTLTVSTTTSIVAGTYTLTITGTSGGQARSASVTLVVTDFSLAATPSSQTLVAGTNTTYTATVGALNGFSGNVALSASGLPAGANASFSLASVSGSGPSTLTVSTTTATAAGTYTVTITGTSGSLTHTATVSLTITPAPDFSLTATPASLTVIVGGGASYTAMIGALNSYTGTVSLSVSGLPTGASAGFSPISVSTSGPSTLTVSTSASTPTGSYPLTITGADSSGSPTHTATVTLVVADFSLTTTPASQTVIQGNGANYTPNVGALNGYSGSVSFSVSGLPAGATASFTPASVSGSGSSTMGISTGASTPTGSYPLTITGTDGGGSLTHSATVTLVVNPPPDFSFAASPASQTLIQGNSGNYTASVGALNGFTGSVLLSASGLPTGASASFSPASVNGSGNSTLNVTTSTSTPVGSYTVTITGTSGSLSHSATVTLTVNPIPPDFSLSAGPGSQAVIVGNGASYTATVGALYGYTGSVSFSVSGLPAGASAGFSPASVTGSGSSVLSVSTAGSTPTGSYPLTITGTDSTGSPIHTATVTLVVNPVPDFSLSAGPASQTVIQGNGVSYAATVGALNGYTGSVSFSVNGLPAGASASFAPASVSGSGNSTMSVSTSTSTPTGSYSLTITGTDGTLTHSASVTLVVNPPPDFSFSTTPASQTVIVGSATSYTASVGAINGFTGSVSLSATGLPAGASASFSPASVSGAGNSTLSVSTSGSTPTGSYTITITGTSGSLTHSATVTLMVNPLPDFSLSATPASQTVLVGGGASYTASIGAINGFIGSVSLSASGLPTGASASFSPTSVSGSGSSTLSVSTSASTPAGSYTITITGTSASLTHSATVTLVVNPVPDFSLAATPASQTITVGGNTTYTATISALNGFSGSVSLSASGLPTGASASFNPASVSGSGTSTVTVSTTTSTPAGSYTLTLTGTSGALTHSATVTLVVNSACITTGATWVNNALPVSETGIFTVAYDATPSTSTNNTVVAISEGVQTAYAGFANLGRFYTNSDIDARNGGAYQAQSVIPYSAGKTYHFRMVINVPAHTYSIYVTPPGGSELTVGLNWAFRTEQNTVTSLDHWGVYAEVGSITVCNFGVQ